MSSQEQVERDLKEYLEKEPNLRRDERIAYLRAIINKHLEFNKLEHVINSYDFTNIVCFSKVEYTKFRLPMKITKRQVDSSDLPHVAMIEAVISYLNKNNLLKKLVKFDITE